MNAFDIAEDALRHARQSGAKNVYRAALHYVSGQLEIAIHHTSAGYGRLPPQKPTRAPKPKPASVD